MQMEESLRELLDLSIDSPDGGISYVNFKALRKLLHCIVQRLGTDRDTADGGRKASVDRDVEESLLDEKGSEDLPGELPSDTKRLSLSIPDTTGEEEEKEEEGVSKCMNLIQCLLKKNQELKEVTNNLKKEMETLKNQFSQVYDSEPLFMGIKSSGVGELDKPVETASPSRDSISGTEQQYDVQTADLRNAVQKLYKAVQNVKQEMQVLKMEQGGTSDRKMLNKELKDSITGTGLSDTSAKFNVPPTLGDSSTDVPDEASSRLSRGVEQYPETPASLLDDMKDNITGTGISDGSAKINVSPTSRDSFTVADESPAQISSGAKKYPETPALKLDVDHLQEMHKGLKARVEHLEGEKENIMDQVNQLKTQLVEMVMADTKIYEMESLVITPESSELGGELDKSAETIIQSEDSVSESEQQPDLQLADLRNAVQELFKAVQYVKQEVLALRIEQKSTVAKEMKDKELKDSISGPGLSDTSAKINVLSTPKESSTAVSDEASSQLSGEVEQYPETPAVQLDVNHLQAMHKSLKARVEYLEGERKHILEQVNQLKTQLMEIVIADTKKVNKTELGGELDKSAETAIQSRDSISGSEQQPDLQTADLRNAVHQLYKEVQDVKEELLALRIEQKKNSEMQDRTTEWTSDVQGAILKLQAEFEKLHSTTQLMQSDTRQQTHIDHLYKAMKELEEKAEEEMKIAKGIKADMHTLETTVSATTQQLNRKFHNLQSNTTVLEENYHTVTGKIFRELKLNHTEIDHLQKQIISLQKAQSAESDNAAIVKKQLLTRFHCLSCDRPVNIKTPGPHIPVVPGMPSFPLRHHRKTMQPTNLSQPEMSPTEMSIKQTREGVSCEFSGQVHKEYQDTTDVKMEMRLTTGQTKEGTISLKKDKQWIPEDSSSQIQPSRQQVSSVQPAKENLNFPVPLKEGFSEYNVNHNQLPASVGKKFRQLSPFRQQHSEAKLICIGTSCFKKEKQWILEDSLPPT